MEYILPSCTYSRYVTQILCTTTHVLKERGGSVKAERGRPSACARQYLLRRLPQRSTIPFTMYCVVDPPVILVLPMAFRFPEMNFCNKEGTQSHPGRFLSQKTPPLLVPSVRPTSCFLVAQRIARAEVGRGRGGGRVHANSPGPSGPTSLHHMDPLFSRLSHVTCPRLHNSFYILRGPARLIRSIW